LAEGSVQFFKKGKLSERTFRLAINPADGQPVNFGE
jgi:hypothetical protein